MKPWKAYEYAVAAYFGAKRRRMRKFQLQGPDVNQAFCDIEVKTRKHLPACLTKPLRKTQTWSSGSKISAVIFLNPETDAVRDGIVVIGVPDFKILLDSYTSQILSATEGSKLSPPSPSEPCSPPPAIPSRSAKTVKAKYRWKSRRLTSRKFSS